MVVLPPSLHYLLNWQQIITRTALTGTGQFSVLQVRWTYTLAKSPWKHGWLANTEMIKQTCNCALHRCINKRYSLSNSKKIFGNVQKLGIKPDLKLLCINFLMIMQITSSNEIITSQSQFHHKSHRKPIPSQVTSYSNKPWQRHSFVIVIPCSLWPNLSRDLWLTCLIQRSG